MEKTSRRPPGELAVGRGGERRGAFVADAVVGQSSTRRLLPAQGVGETQVGVPHHAPDLAYAPVDHGLGHQVARPCRRLQSSSSGEADPDTVFSHLHGEGLHSVVVAGGFAGQGVEIPAMPGTAEQTVLDRALTQGATLVWTLVVERTVFTLEPGSYRG